MNKKVNKSKLKRVLDFKWGTKIKIDLLFDPDIDQVINIKKIVQDKTTRINDNFGLPTQGF